MSKFLKTIVNIILILAVIVAGGLLIPPMAGVTTVIVDDVYMNTNLKQGSVTYAVDAENGFAKGDKVLIKEDGTKYVYDITGVDGDTYTLEDTLSVDGGTEQRTLGRSAKKVLFTIPFVGFVSMALGTTEGLIIVGLGILFVIILFILSEIWKKDEDDNEDADDKDIYTSAAHDGRSLSRKEEKRAEKQARKEEKEAEKQARKEEKRAERQARKEEKRFRRQDDEEECRAMYAEVDSEPDVMENVSNVEECTEEEKRLFEETGDTLAAELAVMMDEDEKNQAEENQAEENVTADETADLEEKLTQAGAETEKAEEAEPADAEETVEAEKPEMPEEPAGEKTVQEALEIEESPAEDPEVVQYEAVSEMKNTGKKEKELAMPVYTRKELEEIIRAEGDNPRVIEDEETGITLFDYSDIL